jgi:hypothetical protein
VNSAPWWVVLASTALGGVLGVLGTLWNSGRERARARREEWFRRVQWADSLTASDDPHRRAAGTRLLGVLGRQDLRDNDTGADAALIDALNRPAGLDELAAAAMVDDVEVVEDTEDQEAHDDDH